MCDREIEANLLGNKMWLAGTMDLNEPPQNLIMIS